MKPSTRCICLHDRALHVREYGPCLDADCACIEYLRQGICQERAAIEAMSITFALDLGLPAELGAAETERMFASGEFKRCSKHPDRWILRDWQGKLREARERAR